MLNPKEAADQIALLIRTQFSSDRYAALVSLLMKTGFKLLSYSSTEASKLPRRLEQAGPDWASKLYLFTIGIMFSFNLFGCT